MTRSDIAPTLQVRMTGGFCTWDGSGTRIQIKSQKSQAILAILLLSPDGISTRRKLETLLWTSRSKQQAQNSLRRELHGLKAALGDAGSGLFTIDRINVELDLTRIKVVGTETASDANGQLLDGMTLFDAAGFDAWLSELRAATAPPASATAPPVQAPEAASPPPAAEPELLPPLEQPGLPGSRRLAADRIPVSILAPQLAAQDPSAISCDFASFSLSYLADQLIKTIYPNRRYEVVDLRELRADIPNTEQVQNHAVAIRGFLIGETIDITADFKSPDGTILWSSRATAETVTSREIFSGIERICTRLFEFLITYADGPHSHHPRKDPMDVGKVLDGLYIPGSLSISEMSSSIGRAIEYDSSGAHIAIRNCVRMLQFGERLNGYDCVTEELVRHDLRKSLERAPHSGLAHCVASHAFSLFLGDDNRAIEHAAWSVARFPSNEIYHAFLALALLRAGQTSNAVRSAEQARSLGGRGKYAAFLDAVSCACQVIAGNFAHAIETGNRALARNPNFNAARKYLFAAYAHLGQFSSAHQIVEKVKSFDCAFGYEGLTTGESAVNIRQALPIMQSATRILGVR